MIGIRRLAGGVFAVMIVAVAMLLVVPAGSASSPRSVPPPPPSDEPSAAARQLPVPLPLTVGPVAVSAATSPGARATVLGQELATCATLHGAIESSGRLDPAGAAAGDAAVSVDGADPIGFVQLDEYQALSAGAGLARPAPPAGAAPVRGCGPDVADPGSASPVTTSPSQVTAVPPDASGTAQGADQAPSADPQDRGQPTSDEASADIGPGTQDGSGGAGVPGEAPAAAETSGDGPVAESLPPALGPAPWGVVVGALGAVAFAMVVPSVVLFALHNRRGTKWVRANVQTVAKVTPALGVQMAPEMDWPGLPTFGVQLALRADGGTQSVTEVEQ